MFAKRINAIAPLTVNYLNGLTKPKGEVDFSLSCLGVVLFRSRIPDYKGIYGNHLLFSSLSGLSDFIQGVISRTDKTTPSFNYLTNTSTEEEKLKEIKDIVSKLKLKELEPIEMYVKQQLQIESFAVYIDEESNSAFIFSPSANLQLYHLCLAFTYTLFPKVFKNKPLNDDEIQILKSLSHKTSEAFMNLMQRALHPIRNEILRSELALCFRSFRQGKITMAERNVSNLRDQIDNVLTEYRRKEEELEKAIIMLEGLKVINNEDSGEEKEVIEYLSKEPRIQNISYENGDLVFDVATVLTNTDVKKFEIAERTQGIFDGYRIDNSSAFFTKANRVMLLKELFANPNPSLMVKISGNIVFQPNRNWMDAPRGQSMMDNSNPVLENCLVNPHYKLHGCPGRNREQIIQCLKQGDLVSAIECSIAATGSVNIGETDITFRPFVQEILTSEKRIIHRIDGTDLTPAEALLWLQTKEKAA